MKSCLSKAKVAVIAAIIILSVGAFATAFAGGAAAVKGDNPSPTVEDDLDAAAGDGQTQNVSFNTSQDVFDKSDGQTFEINILTATGSLVGDDDNYLLNITDSDGDEANLSSGDIDISGTDAAVITIDANEGVSGSNIDITQELKFDVQLSVDGAGDDAAQRGVSYATSNPTTNGSTEFNGATIGDFAITNTSGNVDGEEITYANVSAAVDDVNQDEVIEVGAGNYTNTPITIDTENVTLQSKSGVTPEINANKSQTAINIDEDEITEHLRDLGYKD